MDQYRRKRSQSARVPSPSKVTRTVNRSSNDKLIACDGPHGGSYQTAKQKFPKLAFDSRSCARDKITDEHRIAFELGQRSSEPSAGALMKSLLADEMSKETEGMRRTPSVIAKLMGLDGMPSEPSAYSYKQPKRSSDGFHQKAVSAGSFRHRKACDNQSCRKIAREQPQFKDVYEVRECPRVRTTGCKSLVSPHVRHAEDEMDMLTQNFMDAKRLSTDEKLHDSKEFHGEAEVSDTDNYRFLKFLQERDSLFAKHLHNLHASQESHYEHVRNLKDINAIRHLTDIEASKKIDISMSPEFQVGVHHHISRSQAKSSDKSGTFRPKANDVPTKILLLKPNLEGLGKSAKFSSCSSSLELVSDGDSDTHENGGCRQAELWGKKRSSISISAHKSRESKELAKEITRQMRNKLGEISFNGPFPGYTGYSADESSHEVSVNDSSYESCAAFLTSHTSGRRRFHRKSSASRYAGSSVNTEGKKRLSERWKLSHRSEEFVVGAKGSTLGEMLAICDKDVWLPNLDGEMTQDMSPGGFNWSSKLSGAAEPSGISTKDGWRDGCIRTVSRSKSLQTSDHFGNPETRIRYEACGTGRFLIPKEGSRNGRKKEVNRDFSWQEGSLSGIIRLHDKKLNDAQGSPLRRKGKKSIAEEKNSSVHEPVILESSTFRLDYVLTLDSETVREHVKIPGRVGSGDDQMPLQEYATSVLNDFSSSGLHETAQEPSKTCHIDSSPYSQYCGAHPESPANNREADQPSPVSVLDAPFVEDLSSGSECFERVSAELHGLRMQLRLLKLETGACNASSMLVSGDEDEGSARSSEEARPSAGSESWEASYMADMLVEYEFTDKNPDTFMPVGPHVFEKLEKKYTHQVTRSLRSDRRLLFDQINSCILEIAERFTNPHPWVKPHFGTGTQPSWSKARFEAELCKLLEVAVKQVKEDGDDIGPELLQSNMEWMNLGKCIDDIGCEIGKMLVDELVSEALAM